MIKKIFLIIEEDFRYQKLSCDKTQTKLVHNNMGSILNLTLIKIGFDFRNAHLVM